MKGSRKITRVQLTVKDQNDPAVFGIVTPDPDYKITLKVNKKLNIFLKASLPLEIPGTTGKHLTFSKFTDSRKTPDLVYHLFSNRSGSNFLLPSLKNVDFIFMILDLGKETGTEEVTGWLREIEAVTAVFKLDPKTLRDRNVKYIL